MILQHLFICSIPFIDSMSTISSMGEVLDLLSSMLKAVNPNDRMVCASTLHFLGSFARSSILSASFCVGCKG